MKLKKDQKKCLFLDFLFWDLIYKSNYNPLVLKLYQNARNVENQMAHAELLYENYALEQL